MNRHVDLDHDGFVHVTVPALSVLSKAASNRSAFVKLAWTQSRLAHAARRDAARWEAEGNHRNYVQCRNEARRLWKDARWHLQFARSFKENQHVA